jgi:hypothetical protein
MTTTFDWRAELEAAKAATGWACADCGTQSHVATRGVAGERVRLCVRCAWARRRRAAWR